MELNMVDAMYPDTDSNNELLQWFLLAYMCKGELNRSEANKLCKLDYKYFTEDNKRLYKAIQSQYKERGKVDRLILAEQLGAEYKAVEAVTTHTGDYGTAAEYAKALIKRYSASQINAIYANYASQDIKDAVKLSEEIRKENEECKKALEVFDNPFILDNISEYMINSKGLAADVLEFRNNSGIKTGFTELDNKTAGGIHAGMYVLGAASSLGKTTFTHQIADQLAEQGHKVLFFSMEQSKLEMVSKSISRSMAKKHWKSPKECQNSFYIRKYMFEDARVGVAIDEYMKKTAQNMHIIEGSFETTVDYIKNYVSDFIDANDGVKPIVFVDYLQIIQVPSDKSKMTTKEATDYNVTELKRLSRRFNIPVIVISSVNRSNYLTQIDFESFKESGGIEYTADVVLGLQLNVIHDKIFDDEKSGKNGKRTKMQEAKKAIPREIELVGLKNRFGICNFSCSYLYYPQYDLFEELAEQEPKPIKKAI